MGGPADKKQLGKIMLRQKLVTSSELEELLDQQQQAPGERLGSVAVESGRVDEVDMLRALSEQHGLPGIDVAQTVVPTENLRLIPRDIAAQYKILPFSVKDEHLFLAMADPSDRRVIDEIEFVTGRKIFPYVAVSGPLAKVIDEAYEQLAAGAEYYIGSHAPASYLAELGLSQPAAAQPRRPKHRPSSPRVQPPSTPAIAIVTKEDSGLHEPARVPVARKASRRLPTLDDAFASKVAPLPTGPDDGRPKRAKEDRIVLIVDDEDDIRRMLRRVLTEREVRVVEAARGSEALEKVRECNPDVILLDAMLPEIHGFDICRRIKGSKKYGHIPIIMVSAVYRGWRVAADLKQSYGVTEFLEKPFKISDVVAAVERALEGRPPDEANETLSAEAQDCLAEGIAAYKAGHSDVAIAHLQRGVGLDPLAFRLHYHLGLLYGRRDQLFEGIHSLETSVDLSPSNFSALKNLAVLYQRAGFKHKAIEVWERTLAVAADEDIRKEIKDHLVSLL
ncbi:MAG TPA: response regulator [Polyangiaceae bacterium]|nr:response regulator [Polyangiaceae bacterium]